MTIQANTNIDASSIELATFYLGEAICGIDLLDIREINKKMDMTTVPQAPNYVRGILNLRGQIVTVIDLHKKLGLAESSVDNRARNIIVNSANESIGLLVSRIGDVITAKRDEIEAPPANIGEVQGTYFTGVTKMKTQLVGILDLKRVLEETAGK